MRVHSPLLESIHLDPAYALLSMQNIMTAMQIYGLLDIHAHKCLNDVIFDFFVRGFTDLTVAEVPILFSLLDVDQSGEIEFDEFYLLFCILIACKDQYEKEFIYRHSRSIFQLIDSDDSGQISRQEFANMGILFNFDRKSVLSIFNEFDISGDKQLDFKEFRLFTMACIDEQRIIDAHKKVNAFREYNKRLMENLTPTVKRYIQSRHLPPPIEIEAAIDVTQPPFIIRRYYHHSIAQLIWRFLRRLCSYLKVWLAPVCRCFSNCCKKCFACRKKDPDLAEIFGDKEEKKRCSCCRPCCCCRKKRQSIDFTPIERKRSFRAASTFTARQRKSTQLYDLNSALERLSYVPSDVRRSTVALPTSRPAAFKVKHFD